MYCVVTFTTSIFSHRHIYMHCMTIRIHQLFPRTALTDWSLQRRRNLYCTRQRLTLVYNLHKTQSPKGSVTGAYRCNVNFRQFQRWIHLAQDSNHWKALVNREGNKYLGYVKVGKFVTSCTTLSLSVTEPHSSLAIRTCK
jgi:hypothetical protein